MRHSSITAMHKNNNTPPTPQSLSHANNSHLNVLLLLLLLSDNALGFTQLWLQAVNLVALLHDDVATLIQVLLQVVNVQLPAVQRPLQVLHSKRHAATGWEGNQYWDHKIRIISRVVPLPDLKLPLQVFHSKLHAATGWEGNQHQDHKTRIISRIVPLPDLKLPCTFFTLNSMLWQNRNESKLKPQEHKIW